MATVDRLAAELGVEPERLAGLDPEIAALIAARLRDLADRAAGDELTGLLRRGAGLEAIEREVRRAHRHGDRHLTVAFVDVVGLKAVNDSLGHSAGDNALRELAAALRRRLRAYDLVVRLGGDEIVCALSHSGAAQAGQILADVRADLAARSGLDFRIGVAEIETGDTTETLIARADADLYARRRLDREGESRQKRQGREAHSPA